MKKQTQSIWISVLMSFALLGVEACGTQEDIETDVGPNLTEDSEPYDHLLVGGEDEGGSYLLHDVTVSPEGKISRYRKLLDSPEGWILGCRYEGEGHFLFVSENEMVEPLLYRIAGNDAEGPDLPPVSSLSEINFPGCVITSDGRYLAEKKTGRENKLIVRWIDGSAAEAGEKTFEEGSLGQIFDLGHSRLLVEQTVPALSNGDRITWLREVTIEEVGTTIRVESEGDGRDRSCHLRGSLTHLEINRYLPYAVALISGNFLVLPLDDGFPRKSRDGACEVLETIKQFHHGRFERFEFFGKGSRILAINEDGEPTLFSFNKAGGIIDHVGKLKNPKEADFEFFTPRPDSDIAIAFPRQDGEFVQPWIVRLNEDATVEPLTRLPVSSDGLALFYRTASSQ